MADDPPAAGSADSFLKPGTSQNTISTSPGWTAVLAAEKLGATATADSAKTTVGAQQLGNVSLTTSNLKHVTFASDGNYEYFLETFPTVPAGSQAEAWNAAWTGDASGSGVLLLVPPDINQESQKLADVLAALHVDLSTGSASKVKEFLSVIDATDVLTVTVTAPSPHVTDASPTPGLWCVAAGDSYTVLQRVTFSVTVNDIVTSLTDFVKTELGIALDPSQFTKTDASPSASEPAKLMNFDVTVSSSTTCSATAPFKSQGSTVVVSFAFPLGALRLCIDLTPGSLSLTITPNPASTIDLSLLSLVTGAFLHSSDTPAAQMPDTSSSSTDDPIVSFLGKVHPWYLKVGYEVNPFAGLTGNLSWGVGLLAIMPGTPTAKTPNPQPLILGLAYDSASGTFTGQLLERSYFLDATNLRSLGYDSRLSMTSIVLKALGNSSIIDAVPEKFDLWTLVAPTGSTPPSDIPHCLTQCNMSLTRTASDTTTGGSGGGSGGATTKSCRFNFSARLETAGDETKPASEGGTGTAAPTGFSWISATIFASLATTTTTASGSTTKKSTTRAGVSASFDLNPPSGHEDLLPATADVSVTYDNLDGPGSWLLEGYVENLSVGLLMSFFDHDTQEGAMAVLANLTLKTLDLTYAYTSGVASSFWLRGVLALGELELDLSWQNVNKSVQSGQPTAMAAVKASGATGLPKATQELQGGAPQNRMLFEAYIRASSMAATVGSIVESIVPGAAAALPSFVADIAVDPTGASTPLASLTYGHDSTTGSTLCVMIDIAGFSFTFVQFRTIAKAADSKTNTEAVAASTKRILRFECDKIPMMDQVPVIKELPQPFDSLEYVWVTDDQTVPEQQGITKGDLGTMPSTLPPVQYKEAKQTTKDSDVILAVGHHFMVSVGGKVVLDHVFGSAAAAPATNPVSPPAHLVLVGQVRPPARNVTKHALAASSDPSLKDDDTSTEAKPTKGAAVVQAGPLSVSAIGFQVASGHLFIVLDATLALGGLELSVLGFTISIDLSKIRLNDLKSLTQVVNSLQVDLHGLAVGLERGPLTLAGVFEHIDDGTAEIYKGGIAVGLKAWQVLAVGEYKAVRATATSGGYRAVFVYGKLDGPLVTIEFATISGVRVGFGYNYTVRMPALNELYTFPLISDAGLGSASNDPMAVLNAMEGGDNPFVSSREGGMWFAAGMTITAFDTLTLTAILLLDINTAASADQNAGVIMALLADGVFQMEPLAPPDFSLFYVEVVIKIELNFIQGYIAADAALAPASHVYVPQAHLTGQASFYAWFGSNPHAGDWVVSVGGYARNYTPPTHYPNPDRLQLSFTVGDCIQIVGAGYVAVTPRCAMAGGSLHMSLGVGPVSAYADLLFDAFINFKPFHFRASISLSVGVECSIDILFIHIHISIHLGADLVLWGPHDFGGLAHVDFWFFGFYISFGADENTNAKDPVDIDTFLGMIRAPGPDSAPRPTDTVAGPESADVAIHKWTVEQGLVPARTPAAKPGSTVFPSTGADTEWDVDAASLVMRVDVDFALTDAYFAAPDKDPETGKENPEDPKTATPVPTPIATELESVFAMPMHSQQTATSTLTITVQKNDVVQTGWRAEAVIKSGAPALWSHDAWNGVNDPLQVLDGQQPPAVLRDGKNQPASVDIVQAVRLLAPEPKRARSQIVQFDITAANVESLESDDYAVKFEEEDRAFDATLFEGTETHQTKRWQDFGTMMKRTTNNGALSLDDVRAAVALAASDVFEWAIRPVTAGSADLDADGGWVLKGKSLDRLAGKLDTQWGELPLVAV